MVLEVTRKCDICGAPNAHQWTVHTDGKKWEIDLDDEHSAPLLVILEHGKLESSTPRGSRGPHDLDRTLGPLIRGLPDEIEGK